MSQRLGKNYELHGEWFRWNNIDRMPLPAGVTYWTCDLREKSSGHVYSDGAHRVRLAVPGCPYRSTTFYGETAWSDAARLIGDVATWKRFHG